MYTFVICSTFYLLHTTLTAIANDLNTTSTLNELNNTLNQSDTKQLIEKFNEIVVDDTNYNDEKNDDDETKKGDLKGKNNDNSGVFNLQNYSINSNDSINLTDYYYYYNLIINGTTTTKENLLINLEYEDNDNVTISDDDYLDQIRDFIFPKTWTWVLIFFHSIVFVIGLVGNTLVCVAVYRNHTMRTVTNYFIVNLAVADFLVILFCLPPSVIWDVTMTWFFGIAMCKIVLYLQVGKNKNS